MTTFRILAVAVAFLGVLGYTSEFVRSQEKPPDGWLYWCVKDGTDWDPMEPSESNPGQRCTGSFSCSGTTNNQCNAAGGPGSTCADPNQSGVFFYYKRFKVTLGDDCTTQGAQQDEICEFCDPDYQDDEQDRMICWVEFVYKTKDEEGDCQNPCSIATAYHTQFAFRCKP